MVHVEEGMDAYHKTWRQTLTRDIERVIDALPVHALETLADTRIYLHKKYIYPGKTDSDGAAVYHPGAQWLIDNGNLPEKARCIDLADVEKYVDWRNQNQPYMLLHEFSHAYHHRKIDEWDSSIWNMYDQKVNREGLYSDVYAKTTHWEFFAETTEAFFSKEPWTNGREEELKNDLFPFIREELRNYDNDMFQLLGRIWDIKDTDDYLFPVCIDVQKNPKKNKRGYKKFTKYIRVLNCFDIFAEDGIDDDLVRHAAAVASELLDNDEDGNVDDPNIESALREAKALIPIYDFDGSPAQEEFFKAREGTIAAELFRDEMNIDNTGSFSNRDATVEEILHAINVIGHAEKYSDFEMWDDSDSRLTKAMDVARGGKFVEIPKKYPGQSWYGYDDETCEYDCMAAEYIYWGIVSNMGILARDCNLIKNEWRACLVDDFRRRDHRLYQLIKDFKIPQWAPNGNYRGSRTCFSI